MEDDLKENQKMEDDLKKNQKIFSQFLINLGKNLSWDWLSSLRFLSIYIELTYYIFCPLVCASNTWFLRVFLDTNCLSKYGHCCVKPGK
jgi:hypothetical protein